MLSQLADILIIALLGAFLENTILTKALGTSTMLISARYPKQILSFGLTITYISTASSAIAYFADKHLLNGVSADVYMPLVYVLIVGAVYIITLVLLWRFTNRIFLKFKKFIHLSAFNCAVLGVLFINHQNGGSFAEYIAFAIGTGLGFLFATFLVSMCQDKLTSEEVPASFRGYPLTLVYIGILSMTIFVLK